MSPRSHSLVGRHHLPRKKQHRLPPQIVDASCTTSAAASPTNHRHCLSHKRANASAPSPFSASRLPLHFCADQRSLLTNRRQANPPLHLPHRLLCYLFNKVISRSYSKVKAHLLKISNQGIALCSKVTVPILEQHRREVAVADAAATMCTPRSVPLPMEVPLAVPISVGALSRATVSKRKKHSEIVDSFHLELDKWLMLLLQKCSTLETFPSPWKETQILEPLSLFLPTTKWVVIHLLELTS